MFIDQVTGEQSKPNEKGVKIVTKTRSKQYFREIVNKETKVKELKMVAEGSEIVEEKLVLQSTAAKINGEKQNA